MITWSKQLNIYVKFYFKLLEAFGNRYLGNLQ